LFGVVWLGHLSKVHYRFFELVLSISMYQNIVLHISSRQKESVKNGP
jgi:hypothetical protein